jgi:hypothetical protein
MNVLCGATLLAISSMDDLGLAVAMGVSVGIVVIELLETLFGTGDEER